MNAVRIGLLGASLFLAASPVRAQVTVPGDTIARAKAAFQQIEDGKIDRSTLTPAFNALLTDDVLNVFEQRANALGTADKFQAVEQTDTDGVMTTVFRLHFPSGNLDLTFGIDDATNKIAKLYFVPGPPS
jgi:hypothetical protein